MSKFKSRRHSSLMRLPYRIEMLAHRFIPRWLFHPRWCHVYSMPVGHKDIQRRIGDVPFRNLQFRWATEEDRVALEQQAGVGVVKLRLAEGHQAATLWHDDKLVGTAWFAERRYYDLETHTTINLEPTQSWMFASWVHRDYRERGCYGRMLSEAAQVLCSRGILEILFAVDASNFVSQSVHRSLGAVRTGSLIGARLCGLQYYHLSRKKLT